VPKLTGMALCLGLADSCLASFELSRPPCMHARMWNTVTSPQHACSAEPYYSQHKPTNGWE
jgi:hypothetical protein